MYEMNLYMPEPGKILLLAHRMTCFSNGEYIHLHIPTYICIVYLSKCLHRFTLPTNF